MMWAGTGWHVHVGGRACVHACMRAQEKASIKKAEDECLTKVWC